MERKGARTKHKAAKARSRLDELTFDTFNLHTAAVSRVNGIDQIDTLLRPCAAKGCDFGKLQEETKSDGTSKIVTSRYRVFFSGDYCGVKGGKGQHGVGLAIKEKIIKKAPIWICLLYRREVRASRRLYARSGYCSRGLSRVWRIRDCRSA